MQPLIVGIDWAEKNHVVVYRQEDGRLSAPMQVENNEVAILAWIDSLRQPGRRLAIACEQGDGLLFNLLLAQPDVDYYRINPAALCHYRESRRISRAKDDNHDAGCLALMLSERLDTLTPLRPTSGTELDRLCQVRRGIVDLKTATGQKLLAHLKGDYPQVLRIAEAEIDAPLMRHLLETYPNWTALRAASRGELEANLRRWGVRQIEGRLAAWDQACAVDFPIHLDQVNASTTQSLLNILTCQGEQVKNLEEVIKTAMAKHPDAAKAKSLPGAGNALAPRLVSLIATCPQGARLDVVAGVCPIVRSSGNSRLVQSRIARPIFAHQTLTEFANASIRRCAWAAAFFHHQSTRNPGQSYYTIIRKLAVVWCRIFKAMWAKDSTYDETTYLRALARQHSPLVAVMRSLGTWPPALDQPVNNS